MKARLLVICVIMVLFGIAVALRPVPKEIVRTEDWLENATPVELDGYRAIPGPNGDKQTYRMPKTTYDELQAFGIVSRLFAKGDQQFDVCVIAGNTRNCFHAPEQCFPGQDWKILDHTVTNLTTKTRGTIPITVMHVQHGIQPPVFAAFCFKGPHSVIVASQADLYMNWSLTKFITGEPQEGAFYRFISMDGKMTEAETLAFAADYMDLVKKTSSGIL